MVQVTTTQDSSRSYAGAALQHLKSAGSTVASAATTVASGARDAYSAVAAGAHHGSVLGRYAVLAGTAAALAPVATAAESRRALSSYYYGSSNSGYQCNNQWSYSYVEVEDPQTNTTWSVSTQWRLTYPKILRHALESAGFAATKAYSGSCGWAIADKVWKNGVELGWVETIPPAGTSANDFNQTTMGRAVSAVHGTYPTLEICMTVIGALGAVAALLGCVVCMMGRSKPEAQEAAPELADQPAVELTEKPAPSAVVIGVPANEGYSEVSLQAV